ncbi:MAG: hypothetical protein ACREP9_18510, partial [Candidatus Dormibacteraceae bacterium]
ATDYCPLGMEWITLAIALAGLAISATLAGLRIWESFFSRPRVEMDGVWLDVSDTELEFLFTLSNTGSRSTTIRSISIISEMGYVYQAKEISQRLPARLGPGESSGQFSLHARSDVAHDPGTSIWIGTSRLVAVDGRGQAHEFKVPNFYDGSRIHEWIEDPPK